MSHSGHPERPELLQAACPISLPLWQRLALPSLMGPQNRPPGATRGPSHLSSSQQPFLRTFRAKHFKKLFFTIRREAEICKQKKIPRESTASQTNSLDLGTRTISILYAEKTFYNLFTKSYINNTILFVAGFFF